MGLRNPPKKLRKPDGMTKADWIKTRILKAVTKEDRSVQGSKKRGKQSKIKKIKNEGNKIKEWKTDFIPKKQKIHTRNMRNAIDALKKAKESGITNRSNFQEPKVEPSGPGYFFEEMGRLIKTEPGTSSVAGGRQKTPLFPQESDALFLEFNLKKVPAKCGLNAIRFYLPHSWRDPKTTSVCLFTKDLERKWDSDVDRDARQFKEYLTFEKGVDNLTEVMSLSQLKREYRDYEAKRKLSTAYDVFLVDQRVAPHVHRNLGQHFFKAKKLPTAVSITYGNVKEKIERALGVTCLIVNDYSNTCSVQIGNLSQPTEELLGNYLAIMCRIKDTGKEKLPGGFLNVRSISAVTQNLPSLPVFLSFGSQNEVHLNAWEKKGMKGVEGELTTLDVEEFGSSTVKVYPDGRVAILDKSGKEIEDLELSDDEHKVKKSLGKKKREEEMEEEEEISLKKPKKEEIEDEEYVSAYA